MFNWFKRLILYFKGESALKDEFLPPNLPRNVNNSTDVIIYSFYLKCLGVDQTLEYGSWYYAPEENTLLCKVYHKTEEELDMDTFDMMADSNYFRMITQDEALGLLNYYGYKYADDTNPIVISPIDGRANVSFDNDFNQVALVVGCSSVHAAHLKALYLVLCQNKNTLESQAVLKKCKFFKFNNTNEGK